MSAAVSGVPAEAIEAGRRAIMAEGESGPYKGWPVPPSWAAERYATAVLAAALPSLREQIAAEVLGPVRASLDEYRRTFGTGTGDGRFIGDLLWNDIDRHVSAPVPVVTVRMLNRTPNHAKGQLGTLHDASPSGHVSEYVKWVDYGEPIQWSHGESESTGEWCGPGEYEVVQAAEEVGGDDD